MSIYTKASSFATTKAQEANAEFRKLVVYDAEYTQGVLAIRHLVMGRTGNIGEIRVPGYNGERFTATGILADFTYPDADDSDDSDDSDSRAWDTSGRPVIKGRSPTMQQRNAAVFRRAGFTPPEEAVATKTCGKCGNPVNEETDFKDVMSRREWHISGWCQACQDYVFSLLEDA